MRALALGIPVSALTGALASASLFLFASTAFAAGPRAYGALGSAGVEVKTLDASTSVVVPISGGPSPLIVASHGWSAGGNNQLGWAKHFASYGFVVAVPTFPNPLSPDTATNAGIIEALVSKLTGAMASTYGVSPGAFGLEGHSAGGLATIVAAAKLAPAATVLFDPVDKNGQGKVAYASLCQPVLAIFAQAGSCNLNAEWSGFKATTKSDVVSFTVQGSTHCDGENAKRTLCGPFCGGGADPDRQAVYAHYTTAFFLAKLKGDAAAAAAIADAVVAGDSELVGASHAPSTCGPTNSGGSDAGARDADVTREGGADGSATNTGPDADTNKPEATTTTPATPATPDAGDASGCALTASASGTGSLTVAALTMLALAALRRRQRVSRSHRPMP